MKSILEFLVNKPIKGYSLKKISYDDFITLLKDNKKSNPYIIYFIGVDENHNQENMYILGVNKNFNNILKQYKVNDNIDNDDLKTVDENEDIYIKLLNYIEKQYNIKLKISDSYNKSIVFNNIQKNMLRWANKILNKNCNIYLIK